MELGHEGSGCRSVHPWADLVDPAHIAHENVGPSDSELSNLRLAEILKIIIREKRAVFGDN